MHRFNNQVNEALDKALGDNSLSPEAVARIKELYKRRGDILKPQKPTILPGNNIERLKNTITDLKKLLAGIKKESPN